MDHLPPSDFPVPPPHSGHDPFHGHGDGLSHPGADPFPHHEPVSPFKPIDLNGNVEHEPSNDLLRRLEEESASIPPSQPLTPPPSQTAAANTGLGASENRSAAKSSSKTANSVAAEAKELNKLKTPWGPIAICSGIVIGAALLYKNFKNRAELPQADKGSSPAI